MDPNLFRIDVERVGEVLLAIVILSFVVERALALLFEWRGFIALYEGTAKGTKEIISFVVALGVCWFWKFDAVSVILPREETHFLGYLITAGVIAGGSKASVKLFKDVLGVMSSAEKERLGK